ncbi:MAG: hypothetical protein ACTSW4_01525 [Candidatus Ranarchaeia archaeon]
MGFVESLIRMFIRRVIFGGIDVLKKEQYRVFTVAFVTALLGILSAMALVLLQSTFNETIFFNVPQITVAYSRVVLSSTINLIFSFIITGAITRLKAGIKRKGAILVAIFVITESVFAMDTLLSSLTSGFQSITDAIIVVYESTAWILLLVWASVMVVALFHLVRTYFTGVTGKILNFPRAQGHFFFKDIVQILVLFLGIPYILLFCSGIALAVGLVTRNQFDPVLAGFLGTNGIEERLGLTIALPPSMIRLIIGLLGITAWFFVIEIITKGVNRPAGDLTAEIVGYYFIFTQIRILILLRPIDPVNVATDIVLNVIGILYSIQAFAVRLQHDAEKTNLGIQRNIVAAPKVFVLLGLGLGYLAGLLVALIYDSVPLILCQFDTFILMGGALTSIAAAIYYGRTKSGQKELENSISATKAIQKALASMNKDSAEESLGMMSALLGASIGKTATFFSGLTEKLHALLSENKKKEE